MYVHTSTKQITKIAYDEKEFDDFRHYPFKKMYAKHLPWLVSLAEESAACNEFKNRLQAALNTHQTDNAVVRTISRLISYDGSVINELSTGQAIRIETLSHLWQFLRERLSVVPIPICCLICITSLQLLPKNRRLRMI